MLTNLTHTNVVQFALYFPWQIHLVFAIYTIYIYKFKKVTWLTFYLVYVCLFVRLFNSTIIINAVLTRFLKYFLIIYLSSFN